MDFWKKRKIEKELIYFDKVYRRHTSKDEISWHRDDFDSVVNLEFKKEYGVLFAPVNARNQYNTICLKSTPFVFSFKDNGDIWFALDNYTARHSGYLKLDSGDVIVADKDFYNPKDKGTVTKSEVRSVFDRARFLCNVLDSQKDRNLNSKTTFLLQMMFDEVKQEVFEEYVSTLTSKNKDFEFALDVVFDDLVTLKADVNKMPLTKFVEKYESKTRKRKQTREEFLTQKKQDEFLQNQNKEFKR